MAARSDELSRPSSARLHGVALALYVVLLPLVVATRWRLAGDEHDGRLVRVLLVVLASLWVGFLFQVLSNVVRLRRGRRVSAGGAAWLAGILVALVAFVLPASHSSTPGAPSVPTSQYAPAPPPRSREPRPVTPVSLSALPMALMAKRRADLLREHDEEAFDVDESIELLRARSPEMIERLLAQTGDEIDGVVEVADEPLDQPIEFRRPGRSPVVACVLGPGTRGTLVAFAREGGRLAIAPSWDAEQIEARLVSLGDERLVFARSELELLRLLATRSIRRHVVVHLGTAHDLDDDLVACTITLTPYVDPAREHVRTEGLDTLPAITSSGVRVELLRADPQVIGLVEPFAPTLRRRCVEMVAYLALHRHEPVTGERLRSRVLTHANVDASLRTLANTASAVRRSLGVDAQGPRLHPVTSSGLYATHGLSSDIELFSTLVGQSRRLPLHDAAPLAHEALLLVKGEPLASALRGFEWFLAEGHGARLAREGEYAALVLHQASLERRNYELAFWALEQGLLIDPFSDALREARSRVPRLREFGGDRAGRSQNQSVGAGDAVAMSWSLARFSQQVFE